MTLKNFRQFDELIIQFNSQITALTAPNGGGKSAVLQAMAVACSHFIWSLDINPGISNGFASNDYRLVPQAGEGMTPASGGMSLICEGKAGAGECLWSRERESNKPNARTRYGNALALKEAARILQADSAAYDNHTTEIYTVIPLISYYDTRRLARESKLTQDKRSTNLDRFEGYRDCLALGSSIKVFKDWFKRLSEKELQEQVRLIKQGQASEVILNLEETKKLDIVRLAVDQALKPVGWHNMLWDAERQDIVLAHPQTGTLTFSQLSDGIQNILNLVADMAHRAIRLNPCCGRDLLHEIEGLVMIDEVDMYLHPAWQQHIIQILCDIFPKVQFVISTHSPQVLSTLKKDQIRTLSWQEGKWTAAEPDFSPYAHEAAESLSRIFNTPISPEVKETKEIQRLEAMYRNGQEQEAEKLLQNLAVQGIEINADDIRFWKFVSGN